MKYAQPPLNGFHCLEESYNLRHNNSGLNQFGCVRQCILSHECTTLMYNPHEGVCLLGAQPCAVAEPHGQLMTMVFREEENLECLVPQAVSELDSGTRLVRVWSQKSLVRLERGGNMYVGNSNTPDGGNKLGYFAFGSEQFYHTTDHVLLTVSPKCSMAWLPYTVGQLIPFRAVICGIWNGKPVFALRMSKADGAYTIIMYVEGYPVVSWAVTPYILIRV